MQKTSQVKFQLTFLLTAQKAVCVAFILLHSPSLSCSHNLSHSAAEERERERSVTSTLQPLIAWLYQAVAALAAAVDAICDRAPMRSTTRAVAAAAAKDKQQ